MSHTLPPVLTLAMGSDYHDGCDYLKIITLHKREYVRYRSAIPDPGADPPAARLPHDAAAHGIGAPDRGQRWTPERLTAARAHPAPLPHHEPGHGLQDAGAAEGHRPGPGDRPAGREPLRRLPAQPAPAPGLYALQPDCGRRPGYRAGGHPQAGAGLWLQASHAAHHPVRTVPDLQAARRRLKEGNTHSPCSIANGKQPRARQPATRRAP